MEVAVSDRVAFSCNGEQLDLEVESGATLLTVLREQLHLRSVKDGCAPQGQCGCCTVLVDDRPRVACVTPAARVSGRRVTTVEGLASPVRDALADALVATGGSQCGFCTPGIVVRLAGLLDGAAPERGAVDRALAAHLCRCTGWQTIHEALEVAAGTGPPPSAARSLGAASQRAALEGGTRQTVGREVPLGSGGFADDTAPDGALVAVPRPPGSEVAALEAAGHSWVLGEDLAGARAAAGKVQGRRSTVGEHAPLPLPPRPVDGVRLATGWVDPAYLEPDASWCRPGGEPASASANGGAFGGKVESAAPAAARELAGRLGRPVRVVYAREDCVRLGPKRPPIAAAAVLTAGRVEITGRVARIEPVPVGPVPYALEVALAVEPTPVAGPPVSHALRAPGAEWSVLVEGALDAAGADRSALVTDERTAAVLLDTCCAVGSGALAGARVALDETGVVERIEVRVAAGDPLDVVVLRSYAIGAVHMALGWVLTEGLSVDPDSGEVHDLTIRSFGIVRARDVPPIHIEVVDDPGPPRARSSDAVLAATAAALWNALARTTGERPETFPARQTPTARRLRR